MVSFVSYKIAKLLHENDEEKLVSIDTYRYGLELLISSIVNMLVIIAFSYILGYTIEMLLFIIFFAVLRTSAGGYHANTHFKCLLQYSIISFAVIQLFKIFYQLGFSIPIILLICIITFCLVCKYAPIDSKNKPLNENEHNLYKKRSRYVVLIQIMVILILIIYYKEYLNFILICAGGMLVESITLLPILNKSKKGGIQ